MSQTVDKNGKPVKHNGPHVSVKVVSWINGGVEIPLRIHHRDPKSKHKGESKPKAKGEKKLADEGEETKLPDGHEEAESDPQPVLLIEPKPVEESSTDP
ncbi:hypothetical protein ACJZ2D_000363 [Fusarium nematophilum]